MFQISVRFHTSVFRYSEKYYSVNCLLDNEIYLVFIKIFVIPTYVYCEISPPSVKGFKKFFLIVPECEVFNSGNRRFIVWIRLFSTVINCKLLKVSNYADGKFCTPTV